MNQHPRTALLQDLLARRILMLDGAMGTMIQSYKLNEADYRGSRFADFPHDLKGNNDLLTLTQPQISPASTAVPEAGATYRANRSMPPSRDFGLPMGIWYELNFAGAKCAGSGHKREAKNTDKPARRGGGPTTKNA